MPCQQKTAADDIDDGNDDIGDEGEQERSKSRELERGTGATSTSGGWVKEDGNNASHYDHHNNNSNHDHHDNNNEDSAQKTTRGVEEAHAL